jgi:hypothetical protein
MLREGGYIVTTDPDPTKSKGQKAVVEMSTVTCGHNGELVAVPAMCKPENMPYELCWGCRRFICRRCAAEMHRTLKCEVIETKLEREEERARFGRSLVGG